MRWSWVAELCAASKNDGELPKIQHLALMLPKPLERAVRRGGCQNFQSYDPESGTYTGYDGQRHSCR